MLIRAYGLFWSADEVDWYPGRGSRGRFMLLGKQGTNRPRLRVVDFRRQSGLYILYGNYGAYYVGRTEALGHRLKQHLGDRHAGRWDRFSWFGFRPVLQRRDDRGLNELKTLKTRTVGSMPQQIGELEALLIRALGLESNYARMKFPGAEEWSQIRMHEAQTWLDKVARR